MGKSSKRPATETSHPSSSRRKIFSDALCAAGPGCSKVGLARALLSLDENGVLDTKVFGDEGCEERTARKQFTHAVSDLSGTDTPYGYLVEEMAIPLGDNDDQLKLLYVNPFAFLHHLCRTNTGFSKIVKTYLKNQTNSIIIYFDETRPGNVLRPDYARMVLSVYWTFKELPEYLRCRTAGWFPFTFVRNSKVAEIQGGTSRIAAEVLRKFFNNDNTGFNMSVGVRCETDGENTFVRANLAGILGDEKALKESLGVTGSSGTKPCLACKNVSSKRTDVSGHDYFVTLDCCKYELLDLHTDATFWEMVELLRAKKPLLKKKQFDRLQQSLGLKFDEDNLLFQNDLRTVVKPVSGIFWDWMHVLVSHGLADVELGLFGEALVQAGISIQNLEDFVREFQGLSHKFGKNFLTKRLKGDGVAFKGFSSELLDLLPLIKAFVDMVLVPTGTLKPQCDSFMELCNIVDFMTLGDKALNYVDALKKTIEKHHSLFLTAYDSQNCTPKFHYTMHLPHVLQQLNINVSCFVTERKHRLSKLIASRTFANFENTLLRDFLLRTVDEYNDQSVLDMETLEKDVPLQNQQLLEAFVDAVPNTTQIFASTSARIAVGTVKRNTLVLVKTDDNFQVAKTNCFFKFEFENEEPQFMVYAWMFEQVSPSVWNPLPEPAVIIPTSCIKAVLAFAPLPNGNVRIVEPSLMRLG